jgi:hypothetical protein
MQNSPAFKYFSHGFIVGCDGDTDIDIFKLSDDIHVLTSREWILPEDV